MKKLIIPLILLVIIGLVGAANYYYLNNNLGQNNDETAELPQKTNSFFSEEETEVNILLMGLDAVNDDGERRADALLVANLDLANQKVDVVSIPRDTRVSFPGYDGYHKINDAYALGGANLTREVVEKNLNLSLDHYLKADYQGFKNIVDALGGVEVDVEQEMQYTDQAAGLEIDIEAGQQRLLGSEALEYVRFRDRITADIGRIDRQQKFLQAAYKELLSLKQLVNLPRLVTEVVNHLETDLSLRQIVNLSSNLTASQIEMETLPGQADYVDGVSYWLADWEQLSGLSDSIS